MEYPNYLDLDYLRTLENQPTFFGLGFVQLKVDDQQRLHFWHPETRTPDYDEEWHDHRYSFSSQVLVGSLTNEIAYGEMNKKGDHEVWEVCCKGNGAERVGSGNIHYQTRMVTEVGQVYFLDRDAMHKSHSEKAMTMQTRHLKNQKLKARIMTKEYNSPNPFDLSMPVSRIWDIIDDVIGKPGYHIRDIERGVLGDVSKIREEMDELLDAVKQDARVMELVEMSDMLGAMEAFLDKRHTGYTIVDLLKMKDITKRAFVNGRRT